MKKRNQVAQAALLATVAAGSMMAHAQETVTVTAGVEVDNSIDVALTGQLNFGTVRAAKGSAAADCKVVVLSANPADLTLAAPSSTNATVALGACTATATTNTAVLAGVGGTLERPSFSITGVPAFTSFKVEVPTVPVDLDPVGLPSGSLGFQLTDFKIHASVGSTTAADVVRANNAGAVTFHTGAALSTKYAASGNYESEVVYQGTYNIIVSYN